MTSARTATPTTTHLGDVTVRVPAALAAGTHTDADHLIVVGVTDRMPANAGDVGDLVVATITALQQLIGVVPAPPELTITVVSARGERPKHPWVQALESALEGIVQSLSREYEPGRVRLNLVLADASSEQAFVDAVSLIHGAKGKFFVGATVQA